MFTGAVQVYGVNQWEQLGYTVLYSVQYNTVQYCTVLYCAVQVQYFSTVWSSGSSGAALWQHYTTHSDTTLHCNVIIYTTLHCTVKAPHYTAPWHSREESSEFLLKARNLKSNLPAGSDSIETGLRHLDWIEISRLDGDRVSKCHGHTDVCPRKI